MISILSWAGRSGNCIENMNRQIHKYFVHPAAVLLFIMALASLYSASGTSGADTFVMDQRDPLLFLKYRHVFLAAGVLELLLSAYLLMGCGLWTKLLLAAWLSTCLLVYRLGFRFTGEPNIYDYLGDIPARFFISAHVFDLVMLVVLGWLSIGSYSLLAVLWHKSPKPAGITPTMPPAPDKQQAPLPGGATP